MGHHRRDGHPVAPRARPVTTGRYAHTPMATSLAHPSRGPGRGLALVHPDRETIELDMDRLGTPRMDTPPNAVSGDANCRGVDAPSSWLFSLGASSSSPTPRCPIETTGGIHTPGPPCCHTRDPRRDRHDAAPPDRCTTQLCSLRHPRGPPGVRGSWLVTQAVCWEDRPPTRGSWITESDRAPVPALLLTHPWVANEVPCARLSRANPSTADGRGPSRSTPPSRAGTPAGPAIVGWSFPAR